jgi:hypothetical protein
VEIEYEINHKVEGKHVMQINIHDSCGHVKSEEFFKHMKNEDDLIKYIKSVYPCGVCGVMPKTIKVNSASL